LDKKDFEEERKHVVENLKKMGYIKDKRIERSMLKVKREEFVESKNRENAYIDMPLPIPGEAATISAPHMHAICLSALKLKPGDKFLEIGSGSGIFQAYAREILGKEGKTIGIEIDPETYSFGKKNLERTGYIDVKFVLGDGSKGLPEEAPFDKILISAACPDIPKPLIEQLKPSGVIVAVVGSGYGNQELVYMKKLKSGEITRKDILPVVFVTLKGEYGWK